MRPIDERRWREFGNEILAELRNLRSEVFGVQEQISSIRNQQEASEEHQNDQRQRPLILNAELQIPENVERDRSARDDRQYRVQKWTAVGTWLAFIAVAIYAVITLLIWSANKKSADAAVASIRPWIKITAAEPLQDFTFVGYETTRETTARTDVMISAKNIGRSVALNAYVRGKMTFTEDRDELLKEQALVCSGKLHNSQPIVPINIYPEDDSGQYFFIMGAEDVPPKTKIRHLGAAEVPSEASEDAWLVSPKFIGCVTYTIPATGALVYSNFLYYLEQRYRDPVFGEYTPHYFIVGKNVPMKSLILSAYGAEGFYSN